MHSDQNATFTGHYYDGRSAMARKVVVRLSTNVVAISAGDGVAAHWTYAGLLAPDPVMPNKSTRVAHQDEPYARLVVDDPGFAHGILARAPHLSVHERRARSCRIVCICFAAALVALVLGWAAITYAPRVIASAMPDGFRARLGAQVERVMVGDKRACDGAEGMAALAALRERLQAGDAASQPLEIAVYDLGVVNAFALPGGRIVVSGDLIAGAASADAVAGLLAHEFGHAIERHSEAQLVRLFGLSLLQEALFGSGTGFTKAVGSAATFVAAMRYSRDAERLADEHAVALLRQAEIDSAGLVGFFRSVQDDVGEDADTTLGSLLSLASSHPGIGERIGALETLEPWSSRPALGHDEWRALKSICSSSREVESVFRPD